MSMKIKCPQCCSENLKGSRFCQECGYDFKNLKEKETKDEEAKSLHKEIEKIDDVIFQPKKKGISFKNILIGTFVLGVLGFIGLLFFLASPPANDSTLDPTTTTENSTTFPISYLNITDYKIIYEDYGESYFVGTLKNAYSKAVRNVRVRLDFYHDKALTQLFDTRKVVIENGAEANGAFSFEKPLYFYPQDQYWWIWKIEGADYDL